MPLLIPHVEQIARAKGRDVLVVCFGPKDAYCPFNGRHELSRDLKCQRDALIHWLDDNGIGYERCWNPILKEGEWLAAPYDETIAIDVPYDTSDQNYKRFIERVEFPDGTPRNPDVVCYNFPLERASRAPDTGLGSE